MYICPICNKQFKTKEDIGKHSLPCWKEHHPYHMSKEAPHSQDIVTREVDDGVLDFFASLKRS